MNMNRFAPHVYVIPEDDRDRQLADGFWQHDQVKTSRMKVVEPAGGWNEVLKKFQTEYINLLRQYPLGHVIMPAATGSSAAATTSSTR